MYVTFTVTRDGKRTDHPPQLVRQGLMAEMMTNAAQGARIYSVKTKLTRNA